MIIGTDIVEIKRISKLVKTKRFCRRIFTPKEIKYCEGKKNASMHFAVRFAAKEAIWKILNQVDKTRISFQNIEIITTPTGNPEVKLPVRMRSLQNNFSISLSHTKKYALAVAILDFDKTKNSPTLTD